MKFLFIEDSETFFLWVSRPLEEVGHTCVNAPTVEAAREILAKEKFDAVFVDLNMPKYSPAEVVAISKSLADGTPAIILTGESMRSDISRVADGFVFKDSLNTGEDVVRILPAEAAQCKADMQSARGKIDQTTKIYDAFRLLHRQQA